MHVCSDVRVEGCPPCTPPFHIRCERCHGGATTQMLADSPFEVFLRFHPSCGGADHVRLSVDSVWVPIPSLLHREFVASHPHLCKRPYLSPFFLSLLPAVKLLMSRANSPNSDHFLICIGVSTTLSARTCVSGSVRRVKGLRVACQGQRLLRVSL